MGVVVGRWKKGRRKDHGGVVLEKHANEFQRLALELQSPNNLGARHDSPILRMPIGCKQKKEKGAATHLCWRGFFSSLSMVCVCKGQQMVLKFTRRGAAFLLRKLSWWGCGISSLQKQIAPITGQTACKGSWLEFGVPSFLHSFSSAL